MTPDPLGRLERLVIAEVATSAVRHDVRNKLGAIRNAAYFIRRRLSGSDAWQGDPRNEGFSKLIEDEIECVTTLLDAPSAIATGDAAADVDACVRAAALLARVDAARASFDLELEGGRARGAHDHLVLAIRCVLENAAEASPAGGTVRVIGRPSADGAYTVDVHDRGPGIAEECRADITRPFFTTKAGHAGLGLAIAQRIARAQGGGIAFVHGDAGARVALTFGRAP